ncbi:MAG: (S)-ureidoglycine aminohydrolase [Candidatus Eisenbacteria bacterium]|uniref:(S)-ureidoglycine aminohydrolase n=1 Tax=Eiseniibacteriota bacterium TaxID=2212470 RepID=A0A849SDW7_UNCEI|nr:(S)-ureidoglycine aminohydrolase [Candidatus Eisenbacteria bacterium]
MPQSGLVTSRAVVARNFAILPPDGIPESTLPGWEQTAVRILTAPAMGARFAQYRLDLQPKGGGHHILDAGIEAFFYVISGNVELTVGGRQHSLAPGGFAFLAPGSSFELRARDAAAVTWIKKRYQPHAGLAAHEVVGNEHDMKGEVFNGFTELLLKKLLPVEPSFDMEMNIFTFPPGFSLGVTETHVMEHGLVMLEGQGLYYLGDTWREVKAGDFIWMGPYCPQSFYATGSAPSRYLYYKDVNRDVAL